MDERKNNMLKQNKKREKQKKTHETEVDNIAKFVKEVSIYYCKLHSGLKSEKKYNLGKPHYLPQRLKV